MNVVYKTKASYRYVRVGLQRRQCQHALVLAIKQLYISARLLYRWRRERKKERGRQTHTERESAEQTWSSASSGSGSSWPGKAMQRTDKATTALRSRPRSITDSDQYVVPRTRHGRRRRPTTVAMWRTAFDVSDDLQPHLLTYLLNCNTSQ